MCDRFFARTICLFLLVGPYFSLAEQRPGEFAASITSHVHVRYLLFTPEEYEKAEGKIWPLIVYLHGGSRRGENIEKLREPDYGLPAAYKHPEKFAAIAPMSAPMVSTAWASRLREMPIWAFHGEKDELFPVSDTQDLVQALTAPGNDVRLTILPNRDHYILDTYENQDSIRGSCGTSEEQNKDEKNGVRLTLAPV
jgi:poly(3-hydroxybutyrate) depolymerase